MNTCMISNTWLGEDYSDFLIEKVQLMLKREDSSIDCHDYLNSSSYSYHMDKIDVNWRQKVAEWMFNVIDFYDLERDIVSVAMTYIDRMLAVSLMHHRTGKAQCCILAMTCLKLAIKLLEPRALDMEDMIKIGLNRSISREQMVQMEQDVLFTLDWDVLPCTTVEFAYYMICMIPSNVSRCTKYVILELSKYMAELAICVYKFAAFKSYVKALAIITAAIDSLDTEIAISTESQSTFALRVYDTFKIWPQDNEEVGMLKTEMNTLLHHNTNLNEFVKLILSSHKEEDSNTSESPKSVAMNVSKSSM